MQPNEFFCYGLALDYEKIEYMQGLKRETTQLEASVPQNRSTKTIFSFLLSWLMFCALLRTFVSLESKQLLQSRKLNTDFRNAD